MGLFDWLTGKKDEVAIAKYRIWLTREAKSAGIQREVAQALANPAAPVSSSWWPTSTTACNNFRLRLPGLTKSVSLSPVLISLPAERRPTSPPTRPAAFSSLWANGIRSSPMMRLSWTSPAASPIAVSSSTTSRWKTPC